MEKGKISVWQAAIVTVTNVLGTGIFVLPAYSIIWAKEDAWLIEILVTFSVLIMVFTVEKLGRMFPGETIVEYSETILGKYFGKLVGFLFIFYFFSIGSIIIFELASFMASVTMPETPIVIFISFTGLVIAYTVYNGVEIIARLNVWFFSVVVVSLILITLLALKNMNPDFLRPFLANGLKPILAGCPISYGWRGATLVMAMLIPYVNKPEKVRMPYIYSILILGFLFELNTVSSLATFGPFEGGRISLPLVEMVKLINVGDFVQHIEALLVLVWIGGIFTMSTGWFYCSVLGTAQLLKLKDYRPLIFPMMLIYINMAMLSFRSYPEFVDFAARPWPIYAFLHQTLIPVFLLAIATIRGLGVRSKQKTGGNRA